MDNESYPRQDLITNSDQNLAPATIPTPSANGQPTGSIHPEDPAYPWPPGVVPVKWRCNASDEPPRWKYGSFKKDGQSTVMVDLVTPEQHSSGRIVSYSGIPRSWLRTLDGKPLPDYGEPLPRVKAPSANPGDQYDHPINWTPWGNSRRLIRIFGGTIRYCHPWKSWMTWDGSRWGRDNKGEIIELAKEVVAAMWREAAMAMEEAEAIADEEKKAKAMARAAKFRGWVLSSESKGQIENMIFLAQSQPPIPILPDEFDRDPYLFNCQNGTIDLRDGKLREHRKEDFLTKISPVEFDPKARAPRWEQFEREIFLETKDTRPEDSVALYMRRKIGYALSALDELQEMDLLWGEGSNGKNVYLETCKWVFGDYAIVSEPELLLKHRNERHPTGVADLAGSRLVLTSETGDGMEFAEAVLRRLTGDRFIKSRRICENFFEFPRTFKLVVATNDKPSLKVANKANLRRIRIVPFQATFEQAGVEIAKQGDGPPQVMREDLKLKDKLLAESPGILNLLVEGFLEWQRGGLKPPPVVVAATEEYRGEQDKIGDFIGQYYQSYKDDYADKQEFIDRWIMCPFSKLYEDYVKWCRDNSMSPISKNAVGRQLTKAGYEPHESNGISYRLGLKEMLIRKGQGWDGI
jgi:putative DNA primase/helicase